MYKLIKRIYIRLLNFFFVKEEGAFWPILLEFVLPISMVAWLGLWQAVRLPGIKWWLPVGYMVMFIVAYVVLRIITGKKLVYSESIIYRLAKSLLLIPLNKHLSWFTIKELYSMSCYPEKVMQIQRKLAGLATASDKRMFWFLYDAILMLNKERTFLFSDGNNHSITDRYCLLASYLPMMDDYSSKPFIYEVYERGENDPHGKFNGFIESLAWILYEKVKVIRIRAGQRLGIKNYDGVPIDDYATKELEALLKPAGKFREIVKENIKLQACHQDYTTGTVAKYGIFANVTPFEGGVR